MLGDSRVRAMLPTAKPDEAKRFYLEVLGLKLVHEHQFAIMLDAGGTTLHLQKVQAFTPQPFTALGWTVDDIRATVRGLKAKGVSFERFDGMRQDQDDIWTPPGSAAGVCWFKDPDGNLLSLTEGA